MPLTLATFNVENLFEPRNDAERVRVRAKLEFIAGMLRACDADVVGLQEIGPPELLKEVLGRLGEPGRYGAPVVGTADARGIRCALLSRLPVVESRVHTAESLPFPVFRAGDPPPFAGRIPLRRGVVHARVEAPGNGLVDVFVAHFKSSLRVPLRDVAGNDVPGADAQPRGRAEGALRSLVWRSAEALFVRGLVDDVLAARGADAAVAVVGDLNDVPGSPAVRTVRGDGAGELFDCAAGVDEAARFSCLHDGRKAQIDHVLASAALHARLEGARFLNAGLTSHPAPVKGEPTLPTADSDHAPLVVRFR